MSSQTEKKKKKKKKKRRDCVPYISNYSDRDAWENSVAPAARV